MWLDEVVCLHVVVFVFWLVGWVGGVFLFVCLFVFTRLGLVYHSDLRLCITFPDHSTIQYNIK